MKKDKTLIYLFNEVIDFKSFIISLVATNIFLVVILWSLKNHMTREGLMAIGLLIILVEWIINVLLIKPQRNVRFDENGN